MNKDKLQQIAKENQVAVAIKEVGGLIFANINGRSFKVNGYASFEAKCKELKNYVAPQPIDLTSRLEKYERLVIGSLNA